MQMCAYSASEIPEFSTNLLAAKEKFFFFLNRILCCKPNCARLVSWLIHLLNATKLLQMIRNNAFNSNAVAFCMCVHTLAVHCTHTHTHCVSSYVGRSSRHTMETVRRTMETVCVCVQLLSSRRSHRNLPECICKCHHSIAHKLQLILECSGIFL